MAKDAYPLARGTTWAITVTAMQLGVPIDLTGMHMLVTVRSLLVDGTVDSVSPPIWQGDSEGSGVVFLAQSGETLGQASVIMPGSATQVLPNPIAGPVGLYYDVVVDDGSGNIFQTEEGRILLKARVTLTQP